MKIDYSLRERQGKRLTDLIIEKYGKRGDRPRYTPFIADLGENEILSAATLSRVCHGKDPIDNHVKAFGVVLGVRSEYLLCIDDYKTESEYRQAIISEYEIRKAQPYTDAIGKAVRHIDKTLAIIKRTIPIIESRFQSIIYEIDAPFYMVKRADKFLVYRIEDKDNTQRRTMDGEKTIDKEDREPVCQISSNMIYSLFSSPTSAVSIENQLIHIRRIQMVQSDYSSISLAPDDFMKMIFDIDDDLTHRINTWMRYHDYKIDNIDCSVSFWDTGDDNN